jgi:hypothetical protein
LIKCKIAKDRWLAAPTVGVYFPLPARSMILQLNVASDHMMALICMLEKEFKHFKFLSKNI